MALGFFGNNEDNQQERLPSSIGSKIKMYRELRGMTQQDLGVRCGFNQSSASVRINQYEKGKKEPQEKIIKLIADVLGVDEHVFYNDDYLQVDNIVHAFFDIEDYYGVYPAKCDDGYCLKFGTPIEPTFLYSDFDISSFMDQWYEARERYKIEDRDNDDEKAEKRAKYKLWRAEFPESAGNELVKVSAAKVRMEKLQAEMDELNVRLEGRNELRMLDKALEPYLQDAQGQYEPFSRESDIVFKLLDMLKLKMDVKIHLDDAKATHDIQKHILFGVNIEEMLADKEKLNLYASMVLGLDSIKKYGIMVERDIVSLNKVFYVIHTVDRSQRKYFYKIDDYWDHINFYADNVDSWDEADYDYHDGMLVTLLTRENDHVFEDVKKD